MIYSVEGTFGGVKQYEGFCVAIVKCKSGVSFSVKVSSKTKEAIENKKEVMLFTELILRENLMELYGFYTEKERKSFKLLVSVSGVGPSFAISILSSLTPFELFSCISLKDCDKLCCCKGIGKKIANRIILELKDKFNNFEFSEKEESLMLEENLNESDIVKEAVEALVVLGYLRSDAQNAIISQIEKKSVEELIKKALVLLAKK